MLGFLSRIGSDIGHGASVVARGNNGPNGGVFGFLKNTAVGTAKSAAVTGAGVVNLERLGISKATGTPYTPVQQEIGGHVGSFIGKQSTSGYLGAGIQTAALGLGGPAFKAVEKGIEPIVGGVTGRALAGSASQAPIGAAFNTGAAVESGKPFNFLRTAAVGAGEGAALGAAIPLVGAGAKGTLNRYNSAIETQSKPRLSITDQQVLRDYTDYLNGTNPAKGNELNQLIKDVRKVGDKQGVDLSANATQEDRIQTIGALLDQVGKPRAQGGFVKIPGGDKTNVPEVIPGKAGLTSKDIKNASDEELFTAIRQLPDDAPELPYIQKEFDSRGVKLESHISAKPSTAQPIPKNVSESPKFTPLKKVETPYGNGGTTTTYEPAKLPAVLDDPDLFKTHPYLKDITVKYHSPYDNGSLASHNAKTNTITLDRDLSDSEKILSLRHEVQHAIQNHEGRVKGSLSVDKLGREEYINHPLELEANNAMEDYRQRLTQPTQGAGSNFTKGEKVGFAGILSPADKARTGTFVRQMNDHLAEVNYGDHTELNHVNNLYKLDQDQPTQGAEPLAHTIETPAGTIKIPQAEMDKLSQAKTPAEVKQVIGDSLPENVTNRLSQILPHTQDPNIIKNIISRELSPPLPSPAVGQEINSTSVNAPLNTEGQGTLNNFGQSEAAKQITDTLAEAQKTRALQEQGYSAERSARINASQGVGKDLQGSQGYAAELAQLKGELPKEEYQGLSGHLSPTEQENLFSKLRQEVKDNPNIQGFADVNTQTALRKVIFGEGGVPTNSELGLLKKAFGDNFSNAVKEDVADHNERLNAFKTFGQKLGEVAGVPRTIMASADFSGGLRQGLALATRHPIMFAQEFGKQFKYAFSEKEYEAANKLITEHPDYQLLRQAKVAIQDIGDKPVTAKEEQFVSNLAEKIPVAGRIVHGSNRAYTGLLNNLRARSFYNLVSSARNAGVDFNDVANAKLLKDFGTVVNTSTGRGNLGRFEAAGNALSTALFAPRLIASRLSMLDPRYYINLEPAARREALTTLASLGAVTTSILGLADMAGAKVSLNPTSADFGKIKIGDTRLDILGGYQQYLRLGAQLVEGKSTNSTTGATTELGKGIAASRWDVFTNFLTNKEAPVPSFVTTVLKGKDAAGNPIDYKKEVLDRFTPLLAQDIQDLYTHPNASGGSTAGKIGSAVGGAFGVGLQTYSAQDSPLSSKQKAYIQSIKDQGADKGTVQASTSFFQNLKQSAGTRTNVNSAIDSALKSKDLPKAQQLADQYNKELAQGMTKWAQQYGEQYGNETLQEAYNKQKINLTPTSLQSRIKALNSTKPF